MDAFLDLLRRLSLDVTTLANELRRLLAMRVQLEQVVAWWLAGYGAETIPGTDYTLVLADNWKLKQSAGTAAYLVRVPTDAAVPFPIGRSQINFERFGTGSLTLVGAAGVTLNHASSLTARVQYSVITLTKTDTNRWLVTGDMT
jgi:hypothetical protein